MIIQPSEFFLQRHITQPDVLLELDVITFHYFSFYVSIESIMLLTFHTCLLDIFQP